MISKNPEQRQLYEARLKFQRDEAGRLQAARAEGIEQGIEKGKIFGRITALQNLLGLVESSSDDLSLHTESQLCDLIEQLKHQLRTRGE